MLNQFSNLSCYKEFEMRCALTGISKVDVLREIGHKINDYYFFISEDGIFNWFDLNGNYVENPNVLKEIKEEHIPLSISKCIIPNSVTHIDVSAFFNCYLLTSIAIPNNVTSIGYETFSHCKSLKEITIPNSVTHIDALAFYDCDSLKEITIPNSVSSIGNSVFSGCKSLTSINISDNVTSIGGHVFFGCKSLKEVIFKGKTLDEVKQMENYPFGIKDESIIKCEL